MAPAKPPNASEILIDTPVEGGVEVVFGLPGDGINGIVEALRALLDEVFAHDGPVLVDAVTDANEPTLPPKRREEYLKHLGHVFATGTPGQDDIESLTEELALTSLKP